MLRPAHGLSLRSKKHGPYFARQGGRGCRRRLACSDADQADYALAIDLFCLVVVLIAGKPPFKRLQFCYPFVNASFRLTNKHVSPRRTCCWILDELCHSDMRSLSAQRRTSATGRRRGTINSPASCLVLTSLALSRRSPRTRLYYTAALYNACRCT